MPVSPKHLTLDEWEARVGDQIRRTRVAQRVGQRELATLANVSVGAISNLERGKGSSLKTFVAVVRALGRTDWLETLAPTVAVSPMQMLRNAGTSASPRARVRRGARPPAG